MKPLNLSSIFGMSAIVFILSGVPACSVQQAPCEDIVEVNRQIRQCQQLKKDMNNKEHPQHALTARKLYESECVELRYYRDDYDTICKKNQPPVSSEKK